MQVILSGKTPLRVGLITVQPGVETQVEEQAVGELDPNARARLTVVTDTPAQSALGLSGLQDGDVPIFDAAEGKFVRSADHPTIEVVTAPKE